MELLSAEVGRRVRARRTDLGLQQADLAERARLSPSYISRLESGQAGERLGDLVKIARALGMKLSELAGETDEEFAAEVRRRLPTGGEIALSFERLARATVNQSEAEQAFIQGFLDHLAARYGADESESETPTET
jgi:transcriptional regulator with XRE-family HTH domain